MDLDTFFTTVYVLIGQTHQNQRIVVSRSERACRGDHTGSPVLFMAGGDIAPPLRAFLTLDELPEILMRLLWGGITSARF